MQQPAAQLDTLGRIGVFRALQLGDLLVAVPALRALRTAAPTAEITLVGLPWATEFAARFPHLIDAFIPFPGHPALPEREPDLAAWPAFLEDVQARQFDLALQLHGSGGITNPIVALFGARLMAAFVAPGAWLPPGIAVRYPDSGPETGRLLALTSALGAVSTGTALEFPLRPSDDEELGHLAPWLPRGPFVVVHPGARSSARRWPARHFATVADALAARGFGVVLTGTESEVSVVSGVAARMSAPALNLAGTTSLGALAALLARAKLLVANDTGVSHLAAALGTPSVILFPGSDPHRWAPADRTRHTAVDARDGADPGVVIEAALAHLSAEALHA